MKEQFTIAEEDKGAYIQELFPSINIPEPEFPALINDKPLWPDFWSLEELLSKKASMDPRYWQSQYMCNPVSEEGALIKREWWNVWEDTRPPPCEFIIMALDAAQETNNRADYNGLTVWGVFMNEETKKLCESCADEARESEAVAEQSEAVVQQMMGFKGRR